MSRPNTITAYNCCRLGPQAICHNDHPGIDCCQIAGVGCADDEVVQEPIVLEPIQDPIVQDPIQDPIVQDPIQDPVIQDPIQVTGVVPKDPQPCACSVRSDTIEGLDEFVNL